MSPILEVRDARKHFGGVAAVAGASLDVESGSITALIGPNGAGKTTLFNIVSGFLRPDSGTVVFERRRIDRKPAHRVARSGLVRTFQTAKALTRMTVLENMMLAAPDQRGERLWALANPIAVRRKEREIEGRARELLSLVRLDGHAGEYAGTLSGGQRKLLEFARALMTNPRMVLLDEPMAGVNPTLGLELLDRMQQLQRERGMTFLLIEHDLEAVMAVSHTVHVMSNGVVIATGAPEEVRRSQDVIDAYLGRHGEEAQARQ